MVVDVVLRTGQGVDPRTIHQLADQAEQGLLLLSPGGAAVHLLHEVHQVALDLDAAIAVTVAETHPRIAQQSPQHAGVADGDARDGFATLREDVFAIPQHELERRSSEHFQ